MKYENFSRVKQLMDIINVQKSRLHSLENNTFYIAIMKEDASPTMRAAGQNVLMNLGCSYPEFHDELKTKLIAELKHELKEAESELETL